MARGYALINKETLRLLRGKTQVSFDFLEKTTGKGKDIILSWEDTSSSFLPTINQAKALAKAYRVPFASLYMEPKDIKIAVLPNLRSMRTLYNTNIQDDSVLNVALIDILNARQLLIEVSETLEDDISEFNISVTEPTIKAWAEMIRILFDIDLSVQYKCPSSRQFYLYLKKQIEDNGIFIQCFENVPVETARGISIYFDMLPIIGINDNDRPPAKSFTIIHELVHLLKKAPSMCNDMYSSFTGSSEEVFCNAVAGEVLVPEEALRIALRNYANLDLSIEIIERIANRFSVSKEVIIRRLLDVSPPYISKIEYQTLSDEFNRKIEQDREEARQKSAEGHTQQIFTSPYREAVDKTSLSLSRSFLYGYGEGLFDKQDIARYLGIAQRHIDKYLREVASWVR